MIFKETQGSTYCYCTMAEPWTTWFLFKQLKIKIGKKTNKTNFHSHLVSNQVTKYCAYGDYTLWCKFDIDNTQCCYFSGGRLFSSAWTNREPETYYYRGTQWTIGQCPQTTSDWVHRTVYSIPVTSGKRLLLKNSSVANW